MGRRKLRLGSLLFWILGTLLLGVNLIGLLTAGVRTRRPEQTHVNERVLAVRPAPGVSASMKIGGLGEEPNLQITAKGLTQKVPLRLVFMDTAGTSPPVALKEKISVGANGAVDTQVPLPSRIFREYGVVVVSQGGRVVFRAGLG